MSWKIGCITAVIIVVVSNLFWFYRVLEEGVHKTYQEDSLIASNEKLKLLKEIIPKIADINDKAEFEGLLKSIYPEPHIVLNKESVISVDNLGFVINGSKIKEVIYY